MDHVLLLLLPGLDGTGDLFQPLLEHLSNNLTPTVIAYPPDVFLDYSQLVDYVRERIPTGQPFVILAESFSGPIALEIAATQPKHLLGVILCATFVENPVRKSLRWLQCLVNARLFEVSPPAFLVRRFLLGSQAHVPLVRRFVSAIQQVSGKVLASRLQSVFRVDAKAALQGCRVPVLYLQAAQDKLVGERSLKTIQSFKPDIEVVRIPGPHLLLQREPEKAAEAIRRFLSCLPKMG